MAFGDTSHITNGINVTTHVFTSRLFAYLAGRKAIAHPAWRQVLGIVLVLTLVVFLVWRARPVNVLLVVLGLTVSLVVCIAITSRAGRVLPDGRYQKPNNLVYIDGSHHEAYSPESWRLDGVGGMALTLMRNGYLTLSLPEFSAERLYKAGLLISIAPSQAFSKEERAILREFVLRGGIFILTVGYESAGPSQGILADFGFQMTGNEPAGCKPQALGHFKSPYLRSDNQRVYVRFHAGWPIHCDDHNAQVIAYGVDNQPVIIERQLGSGRIVVVGDTCFAMNKNLEWEDGQLFEGLRENADFWRWFLTRLRDQPIWVPLTLVGETDPNKTGSEGLR
jgi:hypothetical protein